MISLIKLTLKKPCSIWWNVVFPPPVSMSGVQRPIEGANNRVSWCLRVSEVQLSCPSLNAVWNFTVFIDAVCPTFISLRLFYLIVVISIVWLQSFMKTQNRNTSRPGFILENLLFQYEHTRKFNKMPLNTLGQIWRHKLKLLCEKPSAVLPLLLLPPPLPDWLFAG